MIGNGGGAMWNSLKAHATRNPGVSEAAQTSPRRFNSAIASHLGNRVQPGPGNADCLVGYGIGGYYAVSGAYPYPYGWAWSYPYGWGPGPYAYTYPEGVIAVDLYDARTGQPLWHASTEQSLFGVSGPEAEKRIEILVRGPEGEAVVPLVIGTVTTPNEAETAPGTSEE